MSDGMFNLIPARSLRYKHIGRAVLVRDSELLAELGHPETVVAVIDSISLGRDWVSIGIDFWNEQEQATVSVDLEMQPDEDVSIGGQP